MPHKKKGFGTRKRDSAIVPKKDEVGKKEIPKGNQKTVSNQLINALSTAGKKKKAK